MRKQNVYYDDLIVGHVLRTVVISKVPKNGFQDYMKSIGKLGGQEQITTPFQRSQHSGCFAHQTLNRTGLSKNFSCSDSDALVLFPRKCRGVVKDSLHRTPIPYVSIWVENETIGTTSEEDGTFSLNTTPNKVLIFSALGYEKTQKKSLQYSQILLVPKSTVLEEMIVIPRKGTKTREIGETENRLSEAFDSAPSIDLKYFPYSAAYKKTPYLKKVVLYTDSRIPSATLKLHFYSVDAQGKPWAPNC